MWSGASDSACCVLERVIMIHPLVDTHYCCSLRCKIRQAFTQAVLSTWDIFYSHHSFVKIRLNVSPSVKSSSGKLCLASMHYFPSLHHSPVNPHGKYLSTCLFSSNERLCSSTLISNSNNVVNLNNELNLPLYYVISFL